MVAQTIKLTTKQFQKYDAVLRRLCKPGGKGKKSSSVCVPDEIKRQWQQGGTARKDLLSILIEFDGDKDT